MRRLLTLLVVLSVIAYLTFKVAVWWLADQRLADMQSVVADSAVIQRGDIGSGISGQLTLRQSSYQDFRLTQPLQVDYLKFSAGSPWGLISALLDPARMPDSWTLEAESAHLVVDATMLRNWVTEGATPFQPSVLSPVCGPDHRQQLGSGDLVRMGVERLSGDVIIRQSPDALSAEVHTQDTGSLELLWPGARLPVTAPGTIPDTTGQPLALTLRDAGLMRRISAYCARESSLEPEQWTRLVMTRFREGLQARGYQPSEQLLALYRQWLTEGGELTLGLNPSQPAWGIPLRPEDAPGNNASAPAMSVHYNGSEVPDVYLNRIAREEPEVPEEAVEPVVPPAPDVAGWHQQELESAGDWTGRQVRVTLSTGRVVVGRLDRVSEEQLEVARLVDGGEVAYPMSRRAVTRFEVWRRGASR